jgi:hypothetical protein
MDIVERLRGFATPDDVADEMMTEAATEIERVREALEIFADNVKKTNVGIDENWAKTVSPLKAENQQLRKRVELLEGYLNGGLWLVERWTPADTTDARKALGKKNDLA